MVTNNKISDFQIEIVKELNKFHFTLGKEIAKGGYGRIYLIHHNNHKFLAMKYLCVDNNSADPNKKADRLAKIKNETIQSIRLKGLHLIRSHIGIKFNTIDAIGIIMDKAKHRNLNFFISKYHNDSINYSYLYTKDKTWFYNQYENLVRLFVVQIIEGLLCLNNYNIAHMDIKPDNILLTDLFQVKLCDFGEIKSIKEKCRIELKLGTPSYMSPEYYTANRQINSDQLPKIDAFALGVTLYKLIFNKVLFDKSATITLNMFRIQIKQAYYTINTATWVSDDLKDLVKKLLTYKLDDRITIKDASNHLWIQNQDKNEEIKRIGEINYNDQMKFFVQMHSMNNLKLRTRKWNTYRINGYYHS